MPRNFEDNRNSTQIDLQRRSKILLDATVQFCNLRNARDNGAADRYSKMFYSLIGDTDGGTKKLISSHLARNHNTPRPIAYYLAMESSPIAAPFLLISPVFWERDLVQLAKRVDVSGLSIIARRSDINAKIAEAIVERGDKLACSILYKNPVLKLNSISEDQNSILSVPVHNQSEPGITANTEAQSSTKKLLELAGRGGKLGKAKSGIVNPITAQAQQKLSLAERLLEIARQADIDQFARVIAEHIDIPTTNVEKIVRHESGASLVVFLKGMNLSRTVTSQLLLLINKRAARSIAEFTASMAQYDQLSVNQCVDIMRNLGAKKAVEAQQDNAKPMPDTHLGNAVQARRRQISSEHSQPLFGLQRKAS